MFSSDCPSVAGCGGLIRGVLNGTPGITGVGVFHCVLMDNMGAIRKTGTKHVEKGRTLFNIGS